MVHAGALRSLDERVSDLQNPPFGETIKEFFLDLVAPHRPAKKLEEYMMKGKLEDAAECAIQLGNYDLALRLCNQAVARGHWMANLRAAELYESRGEYEPALRHRLAANDFAYAALDAAHLGRHNEAQEYWRRLREGS